ncbi:hypothetical protein N9O56_02835 [Rickettsiales bacterium]|nr:hypothetical protein [Rickettsiales bacterium]
MRDKPVLISIDDANKFIESQKDRMKKQYEGFDDKALYKIEEREPQLKKAAEDRRSYAKRYFVALTQNLDSINEESASDGSAAYEIWEKVPGGKDKLKIIEAEKNFAGLDQYFHATKDDAIQELIEKAKNAHAPAMFPCIKTSGGYGHFMSLFKDASGKIFIINHASPEAGQKGHATILKTQLEAKGLDKVHVIETSFQDTGNSCGFFMLLDYFAILQLVKQKKEINEQNIKKFCQQTILAAHQCATSNDSHSLEDYIRNNIYDFTNNKLGKKARDNIKLINDQVEGFLKSDSSRSTVNFNLDLGRSREDQRAIYMPEFRITFDDFKKKSQLQEILGKEGFKVLAGTSDKELKLQIYGNINVLEKYTQLKTILEKNNYNINFDKNCQLGVERILQKNEEIDKSFKDVSEYWFEIEDYRHWKNIDDFISSFCEDFIANQTGISSEAPATRAKVKKETKNTPSAEHFFNYNGKKYTPKVRLYDTEIMGAVQNVRKRSCDNCIWAPAINTPAALIAGGGFGDGAQSQSEEDAKKNIIKLFQLSSPKQKFSNYYIKRTLFDKLLQQQDFKTLYDSEEHQNLTIFNIKDKTNSVIKIAQKDLIIWQFEEFYREYSSLFDNITSDADLNVARKNFFAISDDLVAEIQKKNSVNNYHRYKESLAESLKRVNKGIMDNIDNFKNNVINNKASRLQTLTDEERHQQEKFNKLKQQIDSGNKSRMIFSLNTGNFHWMTLIVDLSKKEDNKLLCSTTIIDSYNNTSNIKEGNFKDLGNALEEFIQDEFAGKQIDFNHGSIGLGIQKDGNACGVISTEIADIMQDTLVDCKKDAIIQKLKDRELLDRNDKIPVNAMALRAKHMKEVCESGKVVIGNISEFFTQYSDSKTPARDGTTNPFAKPPSPSPSSASATLLSSVSTLASINEDMSDENKEKIKTDTKERLKQETHENNIVRTGMGGIGTLKESEDGNWDFVVEKVFDGGAAKAIGMTSDSVIKNVNKILPDLIKKYNEETRDSGAVKLIDQPEYLLYNTCFLLSRLGATKKEGEANIFTIENESYKEIKDKNNRPKVFIKQGENNYEKATSDKINNLEAASLNSQRITTASRG